MLSPALSVLALLAGLSFTCSQNAEAGEPLTSSDAFSRDLPGAVVHVGVFGLFHPRQLRLSAPDGHALILHAGEERLVLEKSSGVDSANLSVSEKDIAVTARTRVVHALSITVTGRRNEPTDFILAVPGKINRRYRGTLSVEQSAGNLLAIVDMDREIAVASVVAAESGPDTPIEALKAQAVAARSYFAASRGRHADFDFCDTTHCQFLREPPPAQSLAVKAVSATSDLVLAYDAHPFAAMYTRSCGGKTHTPAELSIPSTIYPYFSVECKYCREHPARWSSRIPSAAAAALRSSDESARLEVDRRLGWSAVPSNDFTMKKENDQFILNGTGQGHGIGLCQAGAKAMAEEGADYRKILSHYYPNTTIVPLPAHPASE